MNYFYIDIRNRIFNLIQLQEYLCNNQEISVIFIIFFLLNNNILDFKFKFYY